MNTYERHRGAASRPNRTECFAGAVVALMLLAPAQTHAAVSGSGFGPGLGEAGVMVDTSRVVTPGKGDHRWSVETSLTAPVARIYMLKAGYRITEHSELGFGVAFQNWKSEVDPAGQSNAWTIPLSARSYLWRNAAVEVELWPAYNHFESFVDGRTYKGFELWIEYRAGYRFDLSSNLSLSVLPGVGHPVWAQNRYPRLEPDTRESIWDLLVFVPQVVIGWRL